MQDATVDRMGRDVVLAGYIEPPVRIRDDLLMDVAVRAADVHVRAGVVGNQSRVVTTPRAREIFGWLESRRIARAEQRGHSRERQHDFHPHLTPVSIHGALNSVTSSHDENSKLTPPSTRFVASTCVTVTLPVVAETCSSPPTRQNAPAWSPMCHVLPARVSTGSRMVTRTASSGT